MDPTTGATARGRENEVGAPMNSGTTDASPDERRDRFRGVFL